MRKITKVMISVGGAMIGLLGIDTIRGEILRSKYLEKEYRKELDRRLDAEAIIVDALYSGLTKDEVEDRYDEHNEKFSFRLE